MGRAPPQTPAKGIEIVVALVPAPLAGEAGAAAQEGEGRPDAAAAARVAYEAKGAVGGTVEESEADVRGAAPTEDIAVAGRRPEEDTAGPPEAVAAARTRGLAAAQRATNGAPGRGVEHLRAVLVQSVPAFLGHPCGLAELAPPPRTAMVVEDVVASRPVAVAEPPAEGVDAAAAKADLLVLAPVVRGVVDRTLVDPIRGPLNDLHFVNTWKSKAN